MSILGAASGGLVRAFNRNKISWVGIILFAMLCIVAILAPFVAPYGPIDQSIMVRMHPPSAEHLFGTDGFGRDQFSRAVYGARISLTVGVVSVLLGMSIGGLLGVLAGFYGRWVDTVVMRTMDVLLSFPTLITGIVIVALLGPSMINVIVAITVTLIPKFARIARAPTLAVKERAFIEACRSMGFSDARIIIFHIIPNILTEILVMASLWTANAIMIEAGFAFLGLGVRPPVPTWGGMIREGFEHIFQAPWMSIFPGLCILTAVLSLNLIGDGLRDALDPRLKQVRDMG